MTTAELVLDPYILINGEHYETLSEMKTDCKYTEKLDSLIVERITNDFTNICDVFNLNDGGYITISYNFDTVDRTIHILLEKVNDEEFTKDDTIYIVEDVIDNGPDTWMNEDIEILREDDIKGTAYEGLKIELGFSFLELAYDSISSDEDGESEEDDD